MLNWYRGGEGDGAAARSDGAPARLAARAPFPSVKVPTLVIWGMKDTALLPIQLDGLDALVDDLTIVRLPNAGHFAPWEAADEVAAALEPFLAAEAAASAARAMTQTRSRSRSAARLAAVQALYQQEMEGTPSPGCCKNSTSTGSERRSRTRPITRPSATSSTTSSPAPTRAGTRSTA